ncbi:MAG: hypothetical protein JXR07_14765 [Reichenbachiella sp.]
MEKINLLKVHFLPKDLEEAVLYVSEEYGVAGHLCACGCRNKVITPLDPTEWSITVSKNKASLYPSIGNWQLPCKSHYWIKNGTIEWSHQWTEEEIEMGWKAEELNREKYFSEVNKAQKGKSIFKRIWDWLFSK